ncbi:hypothetical protein EDB87DRAFT_1692978 [Lactarius vividus]|nr:hypothetical protein EDB87DRAFT_1692978 [Lactarius vividus]
MSDSPQVIAVLNYLEQFKILNLPEIEKFFINDFIQDTRPLSLGVPLKNKEEYIAFLQKLADQLGGQPLEITRFGIADASAVSQRVFVHIRVQGTPLEGEPFDIESIYIFTFAEEDKFSILATFDDSKAYPWAK